MTTPATDILADAPTLDEIIKSIRRLKNDRAVVLDDITSELLKCTEAAISEVLHQLFLKVCRTGRVPSEWRDDVIIISLYKGKEPCSECSSYRPITLLSVAGKVFSQVLLNRREPLLAWQRRSQRLGFTRCRLTMDAILALRLLAEIHREFVRSVLAAYISMKAAFDSVDRKALWKALKIQSTPPFSLRLINDLHESTKSCVRTVIDNVSDSFPTSSGVRQGCILSPALFCCAIDWILRRIAPAGNNDRLRNLH